MDSSSSACKSVLLGGCQNFALMSFSLIRNLHQLFHSCTSEPGDGSEHSIDKTGSVPSGISTNRSYSQG